MFVVLCQFNYVWIAFSFSQQIFILYEIHNIYVRNFSKKMFQWSSAKSIDLWSVWSASIPSSFYFLSRMILHLVGATKGEASMFEWELASFVVGITIFSIIVGPVSWELLSKLAESGNLLGTLFRVGPLYSSFRDCCFSVVKGANESLLFVSLILVGSEELLMCCCQSLVELGQLMVLLKWISLWWVCLNYWICVCKQTFRLRVKYIFYYSQLLRPIEYCVLSCPNSQNAIFYGNIFVCIEDNSMFLHGEVFFLI